jgi:hypothetical protein
MDVHVVASTNKLSYEKPGFWLCDDATVVEHVHERATWTQLKEHLDIFFILEQSGLPCDTSANVQVDGDF